MDPTQDSAPRADAKKQSLSELEVLFKDEKEDGRFFREMRLAQNCCPLCGFVQGELKRVGSFPIEEWIFIFHLKKAHGIEP